MNSRRRLNDISANRPGVTLAAALALIALALVLISGVAYTATILTLPSSGEAPSTAHGVFYSTWALFEVSAEQTIYSWYSSTVWALLALVAFAGAAMATQHRAGWILFGTICAIASADEAAQLHERLESIGAMVAQNLGLEFQFTWVLAGGATAVAVALALWPLVRSLPRIGRNLIFAGGFIFLLGALVLETVSGQLITLFEGATWHHYLVTHFEELFEMIGLATALAGASWLFVIQRTEDQWSLSLSGTPAPTTPFAPGTPRVQRRPHASHRQPDKDPPQLARLAKLHRRLGIEPSTALLNDQLHTPCSTFPGASND